MSSYERWTQTVQQLESASGERLADAHVLKANGRHLAMAYLAGYAVEMALKVHFARHTPWQRDTDVQSLPMRLVATKATERARRHRLPKGSSDGHDLVWWTEVLVADHVKTHSWRLSSDLNRLLAESRRLAASWSPALRYTESISPSEAQIILYLAKSILSTLEKVRE